jgi:hypothetical protein
MVMRQEQQKQQQEEQQQDPARSKLESAAETTDEDAPNTTDTSGSTSENTSENTSRRWFHRWSGRYTRYTAAGIIILAFILLGVAGWFGYTQVSPAGEENGSTADHSAGEETEEGQSGPPAHSPPLELRNIIYARTPGGESSSTVYSHPITGGQRSSRLEVEPVGDISFAHTQVSAKYRLVRKKTQLWVGENGQEPEQVHQVDDNKRISSPALSRDGSRVAFAVVTKGINTVPIYSLNLLSGEVTQIYQGNLPGKFWWAPRRWGPDHDRLFLHWGRAGANAPPPGYGVLNLNTGNMEKIAPGGYAAGNFAVSPDGSRIAYSRARKDEDWSSQGGSAPYYVGKPYTLTVEHLARDQNREVATSQKPFRDINWVENRDDPRLAYTQDTSIHLYTPSNDTYITTYEHPKRAIRSIYAITPEAAVVSIGTRSDDTKPTLQYIDLKAKDAQKITDTTPITDNILGVTGQLGGR